MKLKHTVVLLAAGRRIVLVLWLPLIIILLIIGPLVIGLIYTARKEKKRADGLKQMADRLGFEFLPKGDPLCLEGLADFPLYLRGRGKKLWNLIRGKSRSFEVAIFDYKYVTGGGRSSQTWKQSVICLQSPSLTLPPFSLSPKNFWHKLGSLFGKKGIAFDTHPLFSDKYVLQGHDEVAIRNLFSPRVLEFYEQNLGWYTEGSADRLLMYKIRKRVLPDQIPTFLEDGLKALSQFYAAG